MTSFLSRHPLAQHGGLIFPGQILLVAVSGLSIVLLLLWGEALPVRQPGTVLLVVAYVWGASLSVRHAFSADIAALQRILCGAASYVMLGFVFAVLHTVLGLAAPAASVRPLDLEAIREPRWIDFLWLSFSTLTTAGYADLSPVGAWANALCTLESLCGILFPATLIARIASLPAGAAHELGAAVTRGGAEG